MRTDRETILVAVRELFSDAVGFRKDGYPHAADACNALGSLLMAVVQSEKNTDEEIVRHAVRTAQKWKAL